MHQHDSLPLTHPGNFPSPFTSDPSTLLLRHCRAGLGNLQRTKTVSHNAPEMAHLCESPSKTPALPWCLGRSVRADASSEGLEKTQRKSHIHTASWTIYYAEGQESWMPVRNGPSSPPAAWCSFQSSGLGSEKGK